MTIFEIQEKSDRFTYLRVHHLQLDLINWKQFDYPAISLRRYNETNGQNEREEIVEVKATVASFDMPDGRGGRLETHITMYRGTATPQVWSALINEVYAFNMDPQKHWTEMLVPLMEKIVEIEKESRKTSKRREKKLRKALDRMNGLDIRSGG